MEQILFKMILIGITSAGKSTFVSRIISGKFSEDTRITIGADFFTKKLRLNNIDIEMKIWDLAGAEKTAFLLPFYCTGARGAIVMFDLNFLNKIGGSMVKINPEFDEPIRERIASTLVAIIDKIEE